MAIRGIKVEPTKCEAEAPAESVLSDYEKDMMAFVTKQIAKMQKHKELAYNGDIIFAELNSALADYSNVNNSLLTLYAQKKAEYDMSCADFDDWYAEKYVEVRETKNPKDLTPQKYYSAKELELLVRSKYRDEFLLKYKNKLSAESKLQFVEKMMDSWNRYFFVLQTLSKNMASEAQATGASERFERRIMG